MSAYFDSLKAYVGFGDRDGEALAAFAPIAESQYEAIADHFYSCIQEHPDAHRVLDGPEQVQRLKTTLRAWMDSGLRGPHDVSFYERRARIGRVHVRIHLPQQYMFTAMNVIRLDFRAIVEDTLDGDRRLRTNDALDKLFDLELAIMLQTFREDSEERLRRNERLATIGQIAASIGHDLRNPLGVIQSSMYLLGKRTPADDPRIARHLRRIEAQVGQCETIISNLLELARNHPPRREPVDFAALFDRVVTQVAPPPHIRIAQSVEPGVECLADAGLLGQAITNLVTNAVQAHDQKPGSVHLSARAAAGDMVAVEVADDGPGFDAATIARVFEPLVTTRASGTGLGLALVKGVVERHGGRVEARNRPEGGAAVCLTLPHRGDETP